VKRVFAPTLDVALGLQPETRHVAVIGGTSPFDRHLGEQARRELKAFEGRVSFEYFTELSMVDHLLHPGHLRLVGLTLRSDNSSASSRRARSPSPSRTRTCRRRSPDVTLCLYRVAQEAVSNVVKHSSAQRLSLHVRGTPGAVVMTVSDDGVGFDVRAARRGLGLLSMGERVEQLGGTLRLRSERGRSTHVEVTVPCSASGTVEAQAV
jgi:signal transduction histidine kinase